MATRATIKIEGINFAKVYKHWDGYPGRMMQWLETFNKDFFDNRGDDPGYKFAQLLRSSKQYEERLGLDPSNHTGWGSAPFDSDMIPFDSDMGEEFEYTLHADGTVTFKEV